MKVEVDIEVEDVAMKILKEAAQTCASTGDSEDLRMLVAAHNYFAPPEKHLVIRGRIWCGEEVS